MKDMTRKEFEDGVPNVDAEEVLKNIEFHLEAFDRDDTICFNSVFGKQQTAEEIIGTLLEARDVIRDYKKMISNLEQDRLRYSDVVVETLGIDTALDLELRFHGIQTNKKS